MKTQAVKGATAPKDTATSTDRAMRRLLDARDRAQRHLNSANDAEVTCPNCQSLITVQDVTTCGACERYTCENCTVFVEVMDCCSPCAVEINAAAKVPILENFEPVMGINA